MRGRTPGSGRSPSQPVANEPTTRIENILRRRPCRLSCADGISDGVGVGGGRTTVDGSALTLPHAEFTTD